MLLLACAPAAYAALLPRLRPPPRRLEAVVLDADGSFLDPDHKVCHEDDATRHLPTTRPPHYPISPLELPLVLPTCPGGVHVTHSL